MTSARSWGAPRRKRSDRPASICSDVMWWIYEEGVKWVGPCDTIAALMAFCDHAKLQNVSPPPRSRATNGNANTGGSTPNDPRMAVTPPNNVEAADILLSGAVKASASPLVEAGASPCSKQVLQLSVCFCWPHPPRSRNHAGRSLWEQDAYRVR
jgi:hypothetical protein